MRAHFVLSEIGVGLRRNLTMTFAVIVSVALSLALLGGSLLANRHLAARELRDNAPWGSKPGVEADAFDVVSSRG